MMALTTNSSNPPAGNDSAKISGDIGDIQITEVSDSESDSEQDKHNVSKSVVPNLPKNLIKNTDIPVVGSVAITNSDNVQFGNNTYFNGPVTIKQVINKSGVDNLAYNKTEDEGSSSTKPTDTPVKRNQVLLWHKVTLSAVCISILGGILAIILVVQNNHDEDIKILNSPDFTPNVTSSDPLIIAPHVLRIVPRTDWLAQPVENTLNKLKLPVPWVIIAHTATESCYTQSQCVLRVRLIQTFHIESRGWDDIAYNFLVGGDGSVYYGRGWDYEGAHTKYYNRYSIGIAFIGTFNNDPPPKQQVEACRKIIKQGVQLGKIAEDYKLLAHRQLMSTLSPGDKVVDVIKEWPNYVKNDADIKDLLPSQQLKG